MIIHHKSKNRIVHLVYTLNLLLYGLVYLFPASDFGEPNIPIYFKLLLDILFLVSFVACGVQIKINIPQFYFFLFLLSTILIGFVHIFHTSFENYFHYTVRNIVFYSVFFYIDLFSKANIEKFHHFHEKLFKVILYFGLLLFILKILQIPNPFAFKYWMWAKNRLISTFLNPNSLGFYMMFYLLYYYFKNQKITIYSLFIIITIFLSGSFTAIIGVIMFLMYFVTVNLLKKKLNLTYIVLFIIAFPFIIYLAIQNGIFDYILFKIDVLFIHKTKVHTSVSTRVKNMIDLYNYFTVNNTFSVLFGDFNTPIYRRLDSQYLNIFYNYGLLGFFLYIISQVSLFIYMLKGKTYYTKAFILFSIWFFIVAFNLTAYLYRTNVVVFYFFMIKYIFFIEKNSSDKSFLYDK